MKLHGQAVVIMAAALFAFVALAAVAVPAKAHDGTRWGCLAHYESTHRWRLNTGNGHYGGLQFGLSTWRYYGGPNYSGNKYPHKATKAEQVVIGRRTAWKGWEHRPHDHFHAAQGGASAWPNTWGKCN